MRELEDNLLGVQYSFMIGRILEAFDQEKRGRHQGPTKEQLQERLDYRIPKFVATQRYDSERGNTDDLVEPLRSLTM